MDKAALKEATEWMHKGLDWETDEEIQIRGIEALSRELGPVGMSRFISLYHPGEGDYTAERRARLDAMTPEEEEAEHRELMEYLQKNREKREEEKKRPEAAGV